MEINGKASPAAGLPLQIILLNRDLDHLQVGAVAETGVASESADALEMTTGSSVTGRSSVSKL